MRRPKAVMTVYMSLMLLLSSALICTLIESGRISAIRARTRSITYMAADSVFSEFAEPLFSTYGIMGLNLDEGEMLELLGDYIRTNSDTSSFSFFRYTDLYRLSCTDCRISAPVFLTDNGGQIFEDQALDYMKYYLAEDIASRLLDDVQVFERSGNVRGFMEKIEGYSGTFKKVEENVNEISKAVTRVKEAAGDPEGLLEKMSAAASDYKESGSGESAARYKSALNDLKKVKNSLTGDLKKIQEKTSQYYEAVGEAKNAVGALEQELYAARGDYDPETYGLLENEVSDIRQKSTDTDYDYYGAVANEHLVQSSLSKLEGLSPLLANADKNLTSENIAENISLTESALSSFRGFDLNGLGVNFENAKTEKEDDGFISAVMGILDSGILEFIADDISDKSIETDILPSRTVNSAEASDIKESLTSASANKALFGEYILTHFQNITNTKNKTALAYEAEYILAGQSSDRDNLALVAAEIAGIRTGCNLISLLKDPAKRAETYSLAASLVGFTGMPVLIKIAQLLIITAWAVAESIADVKALIEGKKVKTIKESSDWTVSVFGLKNFAASEITGAGSSEGLDYEAYLRILLLMQGKRSQRFHTMDMIQANLCQNESSDFRIRDCFCGFTVQADYSAPPLFITLPFAASLGLGSVGNYSFDAEQSFSY